MTNAIKQEKEAFLLKQLKDGERTGQFLEQALRKSFPGQVSARFRSEMDGLIKRGEVTRDGAGSTATFRLTGKKTAAANKTNQRIKSVGKHVVASSARTSPVPKVEKPPVQRLSAEDVTLLSPALSYLARQGARRMPMILKKAYADSYGTEQIEVLGLAVQHELIIPSDGATVELTREGYRCLDAATAGESFELTSR